MIDKNILINLHRIFVIIRSDIEGESVKPMLECILTVIKDLRNNNELIEIINKNQLLQSKYSKSLVVGNNYIAVKYNTEMIKNILFSVLNKIICLCNKKEYKEAEALVDVIHVFPEIDFDSEEDLISYWNCYILPFTQKWHNDYFSRYKMFFITK